MMIQGDFPDLAELKRLAELVPPLDERRCLFDPQEHCRRFVEEVTRLFDTEWGMALGLVAEIDRLKAEVEALRNQVVYWQCPPGIGLIRCVPDARYRKFSPATRMRYSPVLMVCDEDLRKDAERYRWLRLRLIGVLKDWDDSGKGVLGLSFKIPGEAWRSCDENIDAAMAEAGH